MKRYLTNNIFASLFLICGCSGFLEEEPFSSVSPDNFYQSEADLNAAVVGIYSALVGNGGVNRNFNILTDVNADDLTIPAAPDRIAIDRYSQTADNSVLSEMYSSYYQGIARANELLINIEDAPVPEAVKLQAEGEARFLRGFYYFYLVRWFGAIPMPLTPISNSDDVQLQSSVVNEEMVYEQIIIDLMAAIENLPVSYSETDLGRASQGAARTLLAKVHMTRQEWSAARTQLEEVIGSGEYGLFETYHEIFYPENGNSTEHIFMLQHLQNASSGNLSGGYMTSFFPVTSTLSFGTFNPTTGSTGIFSAYEEGDLRKELYLTQDGTFTYKDRIVASQGILFDNAGDEIPIDQVYVAKYYDPNSLRANADIDFPILRYADVLLMYAEILNELEGPTSTAYDAVNRIRARADLEPLNNNLTKESFREAIYRERRVELAFEGHRWFDLKRTGRLIEVMRPHLLEEFQTSNIQDFHVLYPIPLQEILLSRGGITQNEGY